VTVRVRIERATDQQVRALLQAVPGALFDPMRRELVQTSVVDAHGERSAADKAIRSVTWAMDDVGIRFDEYSIASATSADADGT
jgi:hypothetical protein